MPQKNIFSNYLYLLPCSIWMDICERKFREFNIQKKNIEKEFRLRNKKIREEFDKLDKLKIKKEKLKETKASKEQMIKEEYSSILTQERNLRNQLLTRLSDVNEEDIFQEDHILISKKHDVVGKYFDGIAFITDTDMNRLRERLEESVFMLSGACYQKMPTVKKNDFIECLNYKKILPLNIKIDKQGNDKSEGLQSILFGVYVWTLNNKDIILNGEQLTLLMLEQIDRERKKFEKLRSKFFEVQEVPKENQRTKISEDVRIYVWRRDQGKCTKCGSRQNLEYDHIIPVSKGGSSTARNIQLLCEKCNRAKGANLF